MTRQKKVHGWEAAKANKEILLSELNVLSRWWWSSEGAVARGRWRCGEESALASWVITDCCEAPVSKPTLDASRLGGQPNLPVATTYERDRPPSCGRKSHRHQAPR